MRTKNVFAYGLVALATFFVFTMHAAGQQPQILELITISDASVKPLNQVNEIFMEQNPGYTVEVSAIPGVQEFNTAMAAKISAGEMPDMLVYQWGSQIWLYAKGGHLLDLSDSGIEENLRPITKNVHKYQGGTYAYPLGQFSWGLFVNWDAARKYGMTEMPKNFDEWIETMEMMRKNGLEYPFIVPAKDGSGATGFVFGYLHIVVSGEDPDWYKGTMDGTNAWNGPEMKQLMSDYGRALEYASKDKLGLDWDQAYQRFAKGEGVFLVQGNWGIATIRELVPDVQFTIETFPFQDLIDGKERTISDYDSAVSVASQTEHPEGCIEFLKVLFSEQGGDLIAQHVIALSTVKDSAVVYDESLKPQIPYLNAGNFNGFTEREWIPGIKEIMKKAFQEWMAGRDMDSALARLEAEHKRLLKAKPEFIEDFETIRVTK